MKFEHQPRIEIGPFYRSPDLASSLDWWRKATHHRVELQYKLAEIPA